jgi:hypothetical protein
MKRSTRLALAWAAGASVALALGGCTTTYVGHKLGVDGKLPDGVSGIPYTMTRPEYRVDISADADDPSKAIFTVRQTNVPDPTQRYTLTLDPAWLTSGKLDLNFGESGNITDSTATSTSQVVATIKAIASLAVDVIGIKALKDESSSFTAYLDDIKSICAGVGKTITDDMAEIKVRAENIKEKSGVKAVNDDYYPKSPEQLQCLKKVRDQVIARETNAVKADAQKYTDVAKQLATPTEELKQLKNSISEWVEAGDSAALDFAKTYVAKSTTLSSVPNLNETIDAGLTLVNNRKKAQEARERAVLFADMSPAAYRSRLVKDLARQIDLQYQVLSFAEQRKAAAPELRKIRAEILALEDRRAAELGVLAATRRVRMLDAYLAEIKQTTSANGHTRIAADEHIKLREERDRLKGQIKEATTVTALANNKPDAKVAARTNVPVRIVKASYVQALEETPSALFTDLSEFVIVLEPIPSPGAAKTPTRAKGN